MAPIRDFILCHRLAPPLIIGTPMKCFKILCPLTSCWPGAMHSLRLQGSAALFTSSVRTSQEARYITLTKPHRLMLFEGTVAVYCEMHSVRAECGGFQVYAYMQRYVIELQRVLCGRLPWRVSKPLAI